MFTAFLHVYKRTLYRFLSTSVETKNNAPRLKTSIFNTDGEISAQILTKSDPSAT